MAALREGVDAAGDGDEKWRTRKLEKLEMKLARLEVKKEFVLKKKQEKAHCGEVKKGMRKQEGLQRRLSNIREAKLRVERKQEEIRIRLERLEAGDGVANGEKRMENLRGHLAKLEERQAFLLSREREVEELLRRGGDGCIVMKDDGQHNTAVEYWECHSQQQQPWRRMTVAHHCDVDSGVGLATVGGDIPLDYVFFAKQ
jgi:hypothetical protein